MSPAGGSGKEHQLLGSPRRDAWVTAALGTLTAIVFVLVAVRSTFAHVHAVDERFLRRIQLRYPRIASKVFLNLTRVLSDRLQRTTEQYVALVPEQRATAR